MYRPDERPDVEVRVAESRDSVLASGRDTRVRPGHSGTSSDLAETLPVEWPRAARIVSVVFGRCFQGAQSSLQASGPEGVQPGRWGGAVGGYARKGPRRLAGDAVERMSAAPLREPARTSEAVPSLRVWTTECPSRRCLPTMVRPKPSI